VKDATVAGIESPSLVVLAFVVSPLARITVQALNRMFFTHNAC